jgi:hypothetical protein
MICFEIPEPRDLLTHKLNSEDSSQQIEDRNQTATVFLYTWCIQNYGKILKTKNSTNHEVLP